MFLSVLSKCDIGLQSLEVAVCEGRVGSQVAEAVQGAVGLAIIHYGLHLLEVEIGMPEQLTEGAGVDWEFPYLCFAEGEPPRDVLWQPLYLRQLAEAHKSTETLTVSHNLGAVVAADARNTLQLGSVCGGKSHCFTGMKLGGKETALSLRFCGGEIIFILIEGEGLGLGGRALLMLFIR